MNHLTDDEITGFVSFDTLGNESMELASRVNYHILRCEECRERVRISQKLYDTLTGIQWGKLDDPFGWVYTVC